MKKGQISLFVILGLILIFATIFFLTYKNNLNFFEDEKSSFKIKKFVESCLEQTTHLAQKRIAQSGGKLYHSEEIFFSYDSFGEIVKKQKGFKDIGGVEIIYWYHYDDLSEEFEVDIPEYDTEDRYSIKNQVKFFVEENIEKTCFKKLKFLKMSLELNMILEKLIWKLILKMKIF